MSVDCERKVEVRVLENNGNGEPLVEVLEYLLCVDPLHPAVLH